MPLYRLRLTGPTMTIAVAAAFLLSGCTNGHDRPGGHADISFAVSPGGEKLVFNAAGVGGRDLFRLDLSTLRVTLIAATPDYEVDPDFSPDGKSVVYAAGKPGDRADHIFVRSLDGKTLKQLTAVDANDASPAFSADGSLIVFTRDKTYNWGGSASNWDEGGVLCVMNADGTGARQITPDGSMAIDPHFSPDGRTILFWNEKGLFQVAEDGSSSPRPLGTLGGRESCYSPDGQSVAFSNGRYSPDLRVFVAKTDGTDSKKIADTGREQPSDPGGGWSRPIFKPDGQRIVFLLESWPSGPSGVAKMSLWEADLMGGKTHEIADYSLFDDPLRWAAMRPPRSSPDSIK